MKPIFTQLALVIFCLSAASAPAFAQCNVNDKYDKIISGYHSSIALKDNGTYAVWGSYMKSTGAADQLAPQDLNVTNYPGITGSILKTALGGKNAGAQVDQAFVLTTDGLWSWGVAGNVVSTGVKSGNAFGRTSTTSANGFNTYGLPAAVTPSGVSAMFATYQTLVILTTSGSVWILTQSTLAVEANGGTVSSAGTSTWKQVKTDASTNLSNVIAVRGQVSNATYNAFIALTSSGQVYTWGNSTYLGNSSVSAARNYATLMTLPAEFASSVPKMIGVTGGIGTTTTTKNTYYLLGYSGNLYALGDNTQRQCGDFTTTERTAWVNVKKSAAANDNLTLVNFFSCQEHNCSYPGVAAITTSGTLYTWGNNSSGMIGRTDNGTASGTLTTPSFDPGTPVDFTGKAVSVEMGGHTMVYLKEGSSQFCYVGHYTNGSMGDGTSNNNGSSGATTLKHDCSSTPVINICGSVPVAASSSNSTISSAQSSIPANGTSTSVITIRLKDAMGNNLITSGGTVTVTTTAGTLGPVTDNNDGTYTVVLTSSSGGSSTATLGFAINGVTSSSTVQVLFTSTLPLNWIRASAARQGNTVKLSWTTANEVNVKNYIVERSTNASGWQITGTSVTARNLPGNNTYETTDYDYNPQLLFYRIKQADADGRYTYSSTLLVPAVTASEKIVAYPSPAGNWFSLRNINTADIKQIKLVAADGSTVKLWSRAESVYDIKDIAAGVYVIQVSRNDGSSEILRLIRN